MDEQTEEAARRAYDVWRRRFDSVTRWNELYPGAQVLWLNVAQAVESVRKDQLDLLDWADLREMARNAGWTPETWVPGQVHWGRRNNYGFIEHQHGWAGVRRQSGRLVIDLHGPAAHEDAASSAKLVNPTAVRVLAIARELGIGAS